MRSEKSQTLDVLTVDEFETRVVILSCNHVSALDLFNLKLRYKRQP